MNTTDNTHWGNYATYFESPESCVKCSKPTTSHALYATKDFALSNKDEYDFVLPVCHTCRTQHAPSEIVAEGREHRDKLGEAVGSDVTDVMHAAATGNYRRTKRVKTIGKKAVQTALRRLKPGDVIKVNGMAGKWVLLPDDSEQGKMPQGVVHSMVNLQNKQSKYESAGGFMENRHPLKDDYKLFLLGPDGIEIHDVESLEMLGHIEIEDS